MSLLELNRTDLRKMKLGDLTKIASDMLAEQRRDRQENQLIYYQPASKRAARVHESDARVLGIGGGNGSGKTEVVLIELLSLATGVIPYALKDVPGFREKQRGPVNCRVVCESLTSTLHNVILPKLKWWEWTGVDMPGGERGHYGWVPRDSLIKGDWDKSWSEKYRTLTLLYRNPDNPSEVMGESRIQFMSVDQDPSDFASGDFHFVQLDEPPTLAIWRENEARTMRVAGRMVLSMTWPDDPSIPVDWLFDHVYDKAQSGAKGYEWLDLWTTENHHMDQSAIASQMENWSDTVRSVRIYGKPIRHSNRVHPLFTDVDDFWCFPCGRTISPIDGKCTCGSEDIVAFNHVRSFEAQRPWPTVFVIDPHPRKPHMFLWAQIDPSDDWWVIREGEVDGHPTEVRKYVDRVEADLGLGIARRLIDPNMGRSPSSAHRGITWQDEFDAVGLVTDCADDSEVGRTRVNEMLAPDKGTRRPRLYIHNTCQHSIRQMKRYVWDDYRQSLERDQKQKAKTKDDDFPTMLKYLANSEPDFRRLRGGNQIIHRRDMRPMSRNSTARMPAMRGAM